MLNAILSFGLIILLFVSPTYAARDNNSYDGNIYFLYGANGSLVPPSSTLAKSLERSRTSVIIYYLDDSATSKSFAPKVSALQLLWKNAIDLIPVSTDEFQGIIQNDIKKEGFYWHGNIPQIVVIDGNGKVQLDKEGQVSLEEINAAISNATGLDAPKYSVSIKSFNEYNSEPMKEGYDTPRSMK